MDMTDNITLDLIYGDLQELSQISSGLGCTPKDLVEAIVCAALNVVVTEPRSDDCGRMRDLRAYIEGYTGAASGDLP